MRRERYAMGCDYIDIYSWDMIKMFDFVGSIKGLYGCFDIYTAVELGNINGYVTFRVAEEYSFINFINFINFICMDMPNPRDCLKDLVIESCDKKKVYGYRRVSNDAIYSANNEIENDNEKNTPLYYFFNDIIQPYPANTYILRATSIDGKPAKILNVSIGADLSEERRRSQLIGNVRMAKVLLKRIKDETQDSDIFALEELTKAEMLFNEGQFTQSYKAAIKADALRFPIHYTIKFKKHIRYLLNTFDIAVSCDADAIIDFYVTRYILDTYIKIENNYETISNIKFECCKLDMVIDYRRQCVKKHLL